MEAKDYAIIALAVLLAAAIGGVVFLIVRLRRVTAEDAANAPAAKKVSVVEPISGSPPGADGGRGPPAYRNGAGGPAMIPVAIAESKAQRAVQTAVGDAVAKGQTIAALKDQEIRQLQGQIEQLKAAAARGQRYSAAAPQGDASTTAAASAARAPRDIDVDVDVLRHEDVHLHEVAHAQAQAYAQTASYPQTPAMPPPPPTYNPLQDLSRANVAGADASIDAHAAAAAAGAAAQSQVDAIQLDLTEALAALAGREGRIRELEVAVVHEQAAKDVQAVEAQRLQQDMEVMRARHREELQKMLADLKGIQDDYRGRGGEMERRTRDLAVEANELRAALAAERDEAQAMFHEIERLTQMHRAALADKKVVEEKLARLEEEVKARPILTLPSPRVHPSSTMLAMSPRKGSVGGGADSTRRALNTQLTAVSPRGISPPRSPPARGLPPAQQVDVPAPPRPPSPLLSPVQQLRLRQLNVNVDVTSTKKRTATVDTRVATSSYKATALANIDSALGLAPVDPPLPTFEPDNVRATPAAGGGSVARAPMLSNPLQNW